jgi:hypothetical protein
MRNYIIIFLTMLGINLHAEMEADQFKDLEQSLIRASKSLLDSELSSEQMRSVANLLREFDRVMTRSMPAVSDVKNMPAHVKRSSQLDSSFVLSPMNKKRPREEMKDANGTVAKKLNFEKPADKPLIKNVIYALSAFTDDYTQNLVKSEDKIDVGALFNSKKGKAQDKRFQVMLEIESKFRTLMKNNPNLIRTIKYIGQAESDEHRFCGHNQSINDKENRMKSTKAKYISTSINSGINFRMNTLIYSIPLDELSNMEALMAYIFPVQIFGASAVIANGAAFKNLEKYLQWSKRFDGLKKLGLESVVEDQTDDYLKEMLPFFSIKRQLT